MYSHVLPVLMADAAQWMDSALTRFKGALSSRLSSKTTRVPLSGRGTLGLAVYNASGEGETRTPTPFGT